MYCLKVGNSDLNMESKFTPALNKWLMPVLVLCFSAFHSFAEEIIKVTILADDDYPPYSYVEKGTLKGFYVDLIWRASDHLPPRYKVNLVAMPWKRALAEIEHGRALAIIPPYIHREARPYIAPYSVVLGTEQVVTFCRSGVQLKQALDSEKSPPLAIHVGINAGYLILNEQYYKAIDLGRIKMWENKSTDANLMKLLTDKLDCYVNDRLSILVELNKIKAEMPGVDFSVLKELDQLSANTAHIGYSNTNNLYFPHKEDFVKEMDKAIIKVQSEMGSNVPRSD